MQNIIDGIKVLRFKHPELEKRRLDLLNALENRCSIPGDELDLWILDKIVPNSLEPEIKKQIDEWVAESNPEDV